MSHRVTWIEEGRSFEASPEETVLEAAARADVTLPYECSFGACGSCRVRLLQGDVRYDEPPPGLSEQEASEGFALMCQAHAVSPLVISTDRPLPSVGAAVMRRATIVKHERVCHDVHAVTLSLDRAAGVEGVAFRPGQYLRVHLGHAGTRSFSMASGAGQSELVLHVRRIPGGHFTETVLPALQEGDVLDVEMPLGGFGYHEEDYRPIVMIATGTGLAPLWSMLDALLPDPDRPPIALFWGGRTRADLYLGATLARLAETHADFAYTPVLSRADDQWQGARGYVQDAVIEQLPDLSEHAIYACGSPDMIRDAKHRFAKHGASLRYFYSDSFNFQHAVAVRG